MNNVSDDNYKKTELFLNKKNKNKNLLKLLTCGSVDDGKSTLIGRLLHDTKQIYEDQLFSISNYSKKYRIKKNEIDLSLLVDGLQSEREQGITIDVAYRYFSTEKRKFIIVDTPGHEQYTKNMATGASNCDLAIILIDARKGLLKQTKRHSFIVTLLGIKYLIVAVNKMDLINYEKKIFDKIKKDFINFSINLPKDIKIKFIPISAFLGKNIVFSGISWYTGKTILQEIEDVKIKKNINTKKIRFPIQYIIRNKLDFRGYSGTLESGTLHVNQKIKILPSDIKSTIKEIITFDGKLKKAKCDQAITITLKDEIDISRGDIIVAEDEDTELAKCASLYLVWMDKKPLIVGNSYLGKISGKKNILYVDKIHYQIEINSLKKYNTDNIPLNGIGLIDITFNEPMFLDIYQDSKVTGGIIFIDNISNNTVGAGMIKSFNFNKVKKNQFSDFELELNALIIKYFPHWELKKIFNKN